MDVVLATPVSCTEALAAIASVVSSDQIDRPFCVTRRRRRASDLAGYEQWSCPFECGKVYRKTSTCSIRKHFFKCKKEHPDQDLEFSPPSKVGTGVPGNRWACPYNCGKLYRRTSTMSIYTHLSQCRELHKLKKQKEKVRGNPKITSVLNGHNIQEKRQELAMKLVGTTKIPTVVPGPNSEKGNIPYLSKLCEASNLARNTNATMANSGKLEKRKRSREDSFGSVPDATATVPSKTSKVSNGSSLDRSPAAMVPTFPSAISGSSSFMPFPHALSINPNFEAVNKLDVNTPDQDLRQINNTGALSAFSRLGNLFTEDIAGPSSLVLMGNSQQSTPVKPVVSVPMASQRNSGSHREPISGQQTALKQMQPSNPIIVSMALPMAGHNWPQLQASMPMPLYPYSSPGLFHPNLMNTSPHQLNFLPPPQMNFQTTQFPNCNFSGPRPSQSNLSGTGPNQPL